MKVVSKANEAILAILRKPKTTDGNYRKMQFCVENILDDGVLLFHTLTKELLFLSHQEYDHHLELDYLREHWFVVPEETKDKEYSDLVKWVWANRQKKGKEIVSYSIFTTTDCNARCFYCFEADYKPVGMDAKTAEDVADYIIRNSNKAKPVRLHWFGGETLCNPKVIDIIVNKLRENGFTFSSYITSNGLLFDREAAKKAKEEWNATTVQITLDGMNEEHNRRKNYAAYHGDAFETTVDHIRGLLDAGIVTMVRLNFDMGNLESIRTLTDYLQKEFAGNPNFSAYPAVLFEDCSAWNPDRLPEEQMALQEELFRLRDEMQEKRICFPRTLKRDLPLEHCGANNHGHRTILPDGRFTVCNNVGESNTYGSIYDGITDKEKYERWTNNARIPGKCRSCSWLPECTSFDQCPVKHSTCRQTEHDMMIRKLRKEYKKYLKMLAAQESES